MPKPDFGAFRFPALALGAGGFNTGGRIADDGTRVSRTDSFNGYVRSPGDSKWTMLIRPGDNIDPSLVDVTYFDPSPWGVTGTYEVAICATNSSVIYVCSMGYVYKTADKGATLTRTALTQQANLNANEGGRQTGPCMAVDPVNANVVWLMTKTGARLTINGGTNWSNISTASLPAPSVGRAFIVFDRSSTVSGGRTQGLYAFVNGSGLYRSTDAGATWVSLSGGPLGSGHLAVNGLSGHVYMAGAQAGTDDAPFQRYIPGTGWRTPDTVQGKCTAPSLTNANHLLLFNAGGYVKVSLDGGTSWSSEFIHTRSASKIGWLAAVQSNYMTNGECYADPTTPNRWYMHEGTGTWRADFDPTGSTAPQWIEDSAGIEGLVTTHLMVTPNGRLIGGFHDKGFFSKGRNEANQYPTTFGPDTATAIAHGQMTDYAPEDPEFIVGVNRYAIGAYQRCGCFSTNGGRTWSYFPTDLNTLQPDKAGGNIIAVSKSNYIWLPTNQGHPMFTKDSGATWTNCGIGGNVDRGWHPFYNLGRFVFAHDKVTGNVLAYNVGSDPGDGWTEGDNTTLHGIWRSTNGGQNWTRIKAGTISASRSLDFYSGKLTFVPGQADHVFWCGGDNSQALYRSTDGGVTWATVAGFGETFCYAFGMAARGASYPTIAVIGYRGSEFGLWWSLDNCATWEKLAVYPGGRFDGPMVMAGDMGRFGLFYIGYTGSGVVVADFSAQVVLD